LLTLLLTTALLWYFYKKRAERSTDNDNHEAMTALASNPAASPSDVHHTSDGTTSKGENVENDKGISTPPAADNVKPIALTEAMQPPELPKILPTLGIQVLPPLVPSGMVATGGVYIQPKPIIPQATVLPGTSV
jgi:hypothetical protein